MLLLVLWLSTLKNSSGWVVSIMADSRVVRAEAKLSPYRTLLLATSNSWGKWRVEFPEKVWRPHSGKSNTWEMQLLKGPRVVMEKKGHVLLEVSSSLSVHCPLWALEHHLRKHWPPGITREGVVANSRCTHINSHVLLRCYKDHLDLTTGIHGVHLV